MPAVDELSIVKGLLNGLKEKESWLRCERETNRTRLKHTFVLIKSIALNGWSYFRLTRPWWAHLDSLLRPEREREIKKISWSVSGNEQDTTDTYVCPDVVFEAIWRGLHMARGGGVLKVC